MPNTHAAVLAFVLSSGLVSGAFAQAPARVVLFKAAAEDESMSELAAALDPVLASELAENAAVQITAQAAVDLPSLQLAIDCVGETIDCLRAAASQSEAESLLAPAVRHFEDGIIVTVLYFDPTQVEPIRTIARRYTGERQGEQAIAGLSGMVHELFGNPGARAAPAATPSHERAPPEAAPAPSLAVRSETRAKPGLPILPLVIAGLGVALIGNGVAFGLMSNASMDDYKNTKPSLARSNYEEVIADANGKYDTAETQASIANLMFGLGAGALIGAGVLLFWQIKERPADTDVSLSPSFGPREAGLTLRAAWNDRL